MGDTNSSPSSFLSKQPDSVQGLGVFIQDACCTWSSSEEQALNLVLNHVTLSVSQGSFVAVIGEVRSLFEFYQDVFSKESKNILYGKLIPLEIHTHYILTSQLIKNRYLRSLVQNI